ncbi:outer membrane protein assembly factor BamE [Escherichia coli B12:H4]|uniref:OmpA family protein n=1 Tax=Escherichia coli TaxID=562 RepID=UPI000BE16EE3|nr:outer membrane protein assembly factor BamE [Escherichia coli]EGJ4979541.1 outer membrane protein assembly factor BamE [Escherichia coli]EGJ6410013.1 outer membrane protein assembly factor BamE [Escherichia coli]RFQ16699.1 cell envelope protein SmpA [Escherichia coli]CAD5546492.1 outer membrane protein A [Escherichia coli]CAD5735729.1 outer membrane protein A [Escherichia coli]
MLFTRMMMTGVLSLMLAGCGNLSHVTDEGTTEEVVWPSPDKVMFNHDGTQKGSWPLAEKLRQIKAGMNKDQIYQLAGRPHFAEGLFGVREWDYLFNFTGPEGDYSCQYKILFDRNMDARSFYWKPENCLPEKKERDNKESLPGDILFDFNSWFLTDKGRDELSRVLEKFHNGHVEYMKIEGFTDHLGEKDHNRLLSEKRAESVRGWFIAQGFKAENIHAIGRGDDAPVVFCPELDGDALKECLRPNRRVEITGQSIR